VRFDDGTILTIERYGFDAEEMRSAEVFRRRCGAYPVFVNDAFVERVRKAGLRNAAFETVWASGAAIA